MWKSSHTLINYCQKPKIGKWVALLPLLYISGHVRVHWFVYLTGTRSLFTRLYPASLRTRAAIVLRIVFCFAPFPHRSPLWFHSSYSKFDVQIFTNRWCTVLLEFRVPRIGNAKPVWVSPSVAFPSDADCSADAIVDFFSIRCELVWSGDGPTGASSCCLLDPVCELWNKM